MSTKTEALPIVAWHDPNEEDEGVPLIRASYKTAAPKAFHRYKEALTDHTTATARISELEAEVERLRADAERYRHLRTVSIDQWDRFAHYTEQALDVAIDQARQTQKGGA